MHLRLTAKPAARLSTAKLKKARQHSVKPCCRTRDTLARLHLRTSAPPHRHSHHRQLQNSHQHSIKPCCTPLGIPVKPSRTAR